MANPEELKQAQSRALKYLTYRERTEKEVSQYLNGKGFSTATVRRTLDKLKHLGYLDDRRFALQWGQSRIRSIKPGAYRLTKELEAKGVGAGIVQETIRTLYAETDEKDLARACARKKISGLRHLEPEIQMRRLAGHLQRKGFPTDIVLATVQEFVSPDAGKKSRSRRTPSPSSCTWES